MKKGIKQDLVLLVELFRAKVALGIVTPWGGDSRRFCIAFLGSEAPFYEVGRERSGPGNP